jgi:hypothetical protein
MEMKISLAESVGGFTREVRCLDGKVWVIGPPLGDVVERRMDHGNATLIESDANNTTCEMERIHLPSSIIQTGDVHVFKGKGMPKRTSGGSTQQYGDLYIQYVVEMPGGQTLKSDNLSSEERIELARLLNKLEGGTNPCLKSNDDVHHLEPATASDFGKSHLPETTNHHDEHLHTEEEDAFHTNDLNDFFQRAFGGRSSFGNFGGGGFHYFSSGRGFGHGSQSEDDAKVECNQM